MRSSTSGKMAITGGDNRNNSSKYAGSAVTIEPGRDGGGVRVEEPTLPFLSAVELKVFKRFVENYGNTRKLRPDDAIALDSVFGPTIQQVFEILEEEHVAIRQSCATKRILIEVCGRGTYWIPPGHSVCQCMSYSHGKKEYCKHILAAHLYLAITPKDQYKDIGEEEITQIYKDFLS